MDTSVRVRLSIMMFLQFFVWGAWYVTAPGYLGTIGFKPTDIGNTYSVGPIAGLVTPLFVGLIADRFFSAQKVLAILHLLGGAIMLIAAQLMQGNTPSPGVLNWGFFLGYMLTYYPTLALTNTIAMKHMTDPERQFPGIRVLGTIGWIAAGFALTFAKIETNVGMFYMAGGAAIALGLFSFVLPSTPPVGAGEPVRISELFGLNALSLLKNPSYLVFVLASMLICIPLAFYYQIAARVVELGGMPIGATMSMGQVSEIFFMLVMPLFFVRLGVKWMLAVGMLTWVLRYLLFAFGAPTEIKWMIFLGVVVHGICYDFFFVTGQIYTDQKAPKKIRAQAQGLLVMLTLGLGMMIGAQAAGQVETQHTTQDAIDKNEIVQKLDDSIKDLNEQISEETDSTKLSALETQLETLNASRSDARHAALAAIEWQPLWLKPAGFAAVVLILFVLLFWDKSPTAVADDDSEDAPQTADSDDMIELNPDNPYASS
ncbi:MAG: hypothetical protein CBB71_17390 [Rhodopirellula sp. TMED11]|nr:MAG: hypothetical protein CBB71_17390 [Rhodopirellula sp. TMED11]